MPAPVTRHHLTGCLISNVRRYEDLPVTEARVVIGQDNGVVWEAAQAHGRFFITQDLDFSDARKYLPGTHHSLLLVRLPQPGRTALFDRVTALFRTEDVEDWTACIVTATPRKVRVKRPR